MNHTEIRKIIVDMIVMTDLDTEDMLELVLTLLQKNKTFLRKTEYLHTKEENIQRKFIDYVSQNIDVIRKRIETITNETNR